MIKHGAPVPPFRQLAEILRTKIRTGDLAPGEQLPSVFQLHLDYGVATITVRKAVTLLKDEGLLTTVPGYGTFVAEET